MLYFAYGSNLSHEQMKERCKNSKYIKNIFLEGYKLSFCAIDRDYGVANIVKKLDSKVPGGVWKISTNDEKVMFYIIKRQYSFKPPQRWYVDIINQGYKDCNMDREYLKKRLTHYNVDL